MTDNGSSHTASTIPLSPFHRRNSTSDNIPGSEDDAKGETETDDEEQGKDHYGSTDEEEAEYDESKEMMNG